MKAWKWAVKILKKYEEHSGHLDRQAEKFLNPASPLRRMWEDFIATKEMPAILRFEVSLYRFVPLSDRPAEAEHVFLKDLKQHHSTTESTRHSTVQIYRTWRSRIEVHIEDVSTPPPTASARSGTLAKTPPFAMKS